MVIKGNNSHNATLTGRLHEVNAQVAPSWGSTPDATRVRQENQGTSEQLKRAKTGWHSADN